MTKSFAAGIHEWLGGRTTPGVRELLERDDHDAMSTMLREVRALADEGMAAARTAAAEVSLEDHRARAASRQRGDLKCWCVRRPPSP